SSSGIAERRGSPGLKSRNVRYNPPTRMSLELCILASGSGGNCSVVRSPAGVMLIDAGVGPRTFGKRAAGTGVSLDDVRAICLTHLDRDHFSFRWLKTIVARQIRVFCDAKRVTELLRSVFGEP